MTQMNADETAATSLKIPLFSALWRICVNLRNLRSSASSLLIDRDPKFRSLASLGTTAEPFSLLGITKWPLFAQWPLTPTVAVADRYQRPGRGARSDDPGSSS